MKTLIFGAGASTPFFDPVLNTSYLTKRVCDKNEWSKVIKKYQKYRGNEFAIIDSSTIKSIVDRICFLQKKANFEQVAEILDKISSFGFDKIPTDNMFNLLIGVMDAEFKLLKNISLGSGWGCVPFLLREIIAESILDLQNGHKVKEFKQLISLQHKFIENVCDMDDEISVMSLNYDDCVYDSLVGLGFEDGFQFADEGCLLQIGKFMYAKKVVYFPHGHLKFQFADNDNVFFWKDSNDANEKRWNGIKDNAIFSTSTVLPGRFAYNYNTFLSTGQTKDEGLNHLPYAIYYQRLAVDLFKSDIVYVIGYSFGDDHINRLLRSFLQLSSKNKIIIVDYYSDDVTICNEYNDPDNIINKIWQRLGTEWEISCAHLCEIEKLNKDGYGNLFPQVLFYKKGYKCFFNEFNCVIRGT